jgi:short-subunit dehydrogenase
MAKKEASPSRGSGRRALVTGASSGIGAAFARRLAGDRYDLVLVARDKDRLNDLATELSGEHGIDVTPLPADLTKTVSLRKVERAIAADDTLEILINNAGFGTMGQFAELDVDREEEEVRLNALAVLRLTHAALPGMIARRRGAVVNVSSLAGLQPAPTNATYAATKAFVNAFTESIHEELRGTGVQVQALCPGFTRTEFQERAGIDVSTIPEVAWMDASEVVEASLSGLRRGEVVCVPGVLNRLLATAVTTIPRPITRQIMGMAARQILRHQ